VNGTLGLSVLVTPAGRCSRAWAGRLACLRARIAHPCSSVAISCADSRESSFHVTAACSLLPRARERRHRAVVDSGQHAVRGCRAHPVVGQRTAHAAVLWHTCSALPRSGPASWYQVVRATGAASGPLSSPTFCPYDSPRTVGETKQGFLRMGRPTQQATYPRSCWGFASHWWEIPTLGPVRVVSAPPSWISCTRRSGTYTHRALIDDPAGRCRTLSSDGASRLRARQVVDLGWSLGARQFRHRRGRARRP